MISAQVVRVNRVLKNVDHKLEKTEAQAAWQISWVVSLGVLFVGVPRASVSSTDFVRPVAEFSPAVSQSSRRSYALFPAGVGGLYVASEQNR